MSKHEISIGIHLNAHAGEYERMKEQWMAAEDMGVSRLWTSDHMHAVVTDEEFMTNTNDGKFGKSSGLNVFEGTTIQAAMAATTTRAEIGCVVMSNAYRYPMMTAFLAGTLDHISGGRFILGLGTGFFQPDFELLGIEHGTQKERSEKMARDIPEILDRLPQLSPPPQRKIPLMVASMGEKIGLPVVARHADLWHGYGTVAKMKQKIESLKRCCEAEGRDFDEIELTTNYMPQAIPGEENSLEEYVKAGFTHIFCVCQGPDWDLTELGEVLDRRDSLVVPG